MIKIYSGGRSLYPHRMHISRPTFYISKFLSSVLFDQHCRQQYSLKFKQLFHLYVQSLFGAKSFAGTVGTVRMPSNDRRLLCRIVVYEALEKREVVNFSCKFRFPVAWRNLALILIFALGRSIFPYFCGAVAQE